MQEKSSHYSNKGGHQVRSTANKALYRADRDGLPLNKGDVISFCMRRFTRRITNDGKR